MGGGSGFRFAGLQGQGGIIGAIDYAPVIRVYDPDPFYQVGKTVAGRIEIDHIIRLKEIQVGEKTPAAAAMPGDGHIAGLRAGEIAHLKVDRGLVQEGFIKDISAFAADHHQVNADLGDLQPGWLPFGQDHPAKGLRRLRNFEK